MITDKEAREAAIKIKEYCSTRKNCGSCVFGGDCITDGMRPSDWCIETEALSDMERRFAGKALERGFDMVTIDYDADGRHVFIYDKAQPLRYEFLRADSFPSLHNAGDYSLRDMIRGTYDLQN